MLVLPLRGWVKCFRVVSSDIYVFGGLIPGYCHVIDKHWNDGSKIRTYTG